jgi:hypothetical protein
MPTFFERLSTAANPSNDKAIKAAATATMAAGAALATGTAGATAAAVATSVVTAIGISVATGGLAIVGAGALLLTPTVLKVLRARQRGAAAKGDEISKDDASYQYWDCHMSRVAVVGVRGTGKSTLRQLLRSRHYAALGSTHSTEYYISELKGTPNKYAVILDTPGKRDTAGDQWNAARTANILIFVFDHFDTRDKGETEPRVDQARLQAHEVFAKEIFDLIKRTNMEGLNKVIFLMAKKDLWMKVSRVEVERWMINLKSRLIEEYSSVIPDPLLFIPFDRDSQNDLQLLVSEIRSAAK